ncbi:MAG: efflux RND transporter periplasmic adaptor subunit [Candidatus Sericytochromatia bacterium]
MKHPLLSLCLLTGLLGACAAPEAKTVSTLPIRQQTFAHVLSTEGELVPLVQETLTVPQRLSGTLEMLLPEGQQVKKGTVVARISTRAAAERMAGFADRAQQEQANLQQQRVELPLERLKVQSEVKQKERDARLQELELQIAKQGPRLNERVQAQVNLDIPTLQQSAYPLAEKEALYDKGYLSEQELLAARLEYETLQTQKETAALSLEQQSATYRQPDIRSAELNARSAELEAQISKMTGEAQQNLLRTRTRNQGNRVESFARRSSAMQMRMQGGDLKAPFDGVVLHPQLWGGSDTPYVGMEVWSGLPVVQVARIDKLKVSTRINEFDIPYVKPGLKVRLSNPGLPGQVWTGKVDKVQKLAKYKDENNPVGIKYFDIEIGLDAQPPALKANMTLQVEIDVQQLPNAWVVPLEALSEKDGKTFLELADGSGSRAQEVTVLARSSDFAALKGPFAADTRFRLKASEKSGAL